MVIRVVWEYATGGAIKAGPTLCGDSVVIGSTDGRLYCLDGESGRLKWSYKTDGPIERSDAVEAGRRVVVGSKDGGVHCLRAGDGRLEWRFMTGGEITASPLVVDRRVLAGSTDGLVYCLGLDDGAELWRFAAAGEVNCRPCRAGESIVFGRGLPGWKGVFWLRQRQGLLPRRGLTGRWSPWVPAAAHRISPSL